MFTGVNRKKLEEIESLIRNVRVLPSDPNNERDRYPNDVAMLVIAQEKLTQLLAELLMREL